MERSRFVTVLIWSADSPQMAVGWPGENQSAVEKAGVWKPVKTKSRFSPAPTLPWKSRQRREIPTFPPRRLRLLAIGGSQNKTGTERGPWKSGNPKAGFPLSHRPDSLRRKEEKPFLPKMR